jgi:hypothetical protein
MKNVDKKNCPKGNEIKTCKKCGFTGTKFPFFHRSNIKGINQYGNCKKCTQAKTRAWRYGVSIKKMNKLLNNATHCEICEIKFTTNRKVIDHCHNKQNKNIRGILCDPCNTTLGHLEKTPEFMGNVIAYLLKHKNNYNHLKPINYDIKSEISSNSNKI